MGIIGPSLTPLAPNRDLERGAARSARPRAHLPMYGWDEICDSAARDPSPARASRFSASERSVRMP